MFLEILNKFLMQKKQVYILSLPSKSLGHHFQMLRSHIPSYTHFTA